MIHCIVVLSILCAGNIAANTPVSDTVRLKCSGNDITIVKNSDAIVRIGSDARLPAGETCDDFVVIGGSGKIEGRVKGDVVIIGGTLELEDSVDGDVVIIGGSGTFDSSVSIKGDLVLIGAQDSITSNITVKGEKIRVFPNLSTILAHVKAYTHACLFKGRFIAWQVRWTIWLSFIFILLGISFSLLFHKSFSHSTRLMREKPGILLIAGMLAAVGVGPMLTLLTATVIGIPVAIVTLILFAVLLLIGCIAVAAAFGRTLLSPLGNPMVSAVPAALFGIILLFGASLLPWIGGIVTLFVLTLGLGAGVFGFFERIKETRNGKNNPPPPPSPTVTNETTISQTQSANTVSEQLAGMWERLGAGIIDIIVISVVFFAAPFKPVLLLAYLAIMWGWKGSSLGNAVFHLKVRTMQGEQVSYEAAAIRSLGLVLSILPLGLGFFWILGDPMRQGWHDKVAGTKVIKLPVGTPVFK